MGGLLLLFQSFPMASALCTAFALFNKIRRRYTLWSATRFIAVDAVRYADVWDAIVRDAGNQSALEEISALAEQQSVSAEEARDHVVINVRNSDAPPRSGQDAYVGSPFGALIRGRARVKTSLRDNVSEQGATHTPPPKVTMMPSVSSLAGMLARIGSSSSDADVGTINAKENGVPHITEATLLRQCNRLESESEVVAECIMSREGFVDVAKTRTGYMALRSLCRYDMRMRELDEELAGVRGMVCVCACTYVCMYGRELVGGMCMYMCESEGSGRGRGAWYVYVCVLLLVCACVYGRELVGVMYGVCVRECVCCWCVHVCMYVCMCARELVGLRHSVCGCVCMCRYVCI